MKPKYQRATKRAGKMCLLGLLLAPFDSSLRAADVFTQGIVKYEYFGNITGTDVASLQNDARYVANTPDTILWMPSLDTRSVLPTDDHENYGARITGVIIPTETAQYDFFLRSDDASQFYLSTDSDPANLTMVAEEAGCCNAFLEPSDPDGTTHAQTTQAPISLTSGQHYPFQILLKEGGGGDYAQVAWRKVGDTTPAGSLSPIGPFYIGSTNAGGGSVTITRQPASATVAENTPVSFSLGFDSTHPAVAGTVGNMNTNAVGVQWLRNGVPIPGATGTNYSIALAKASDNNAKFSVFLSVPGATNVSTEATLTVTPDVTAPKVTSAFAAGTFTNVTVVFSEPVTEASAETLANYVGGGGLTILGAELINPTTVRLQTSQQTPGSNYTLTLSNIRDTATATPNSIAANTQLPIQAWLLGTGALRVDRFFNISGTTVDLLTSDPRYPDNPDDTVYWNNFGPFASGNPYGDNYGASITGWLIPPTNGLYKFFLRSDDSSQFFISSDETAANLPATPNAEQTGCCNAFTDTEGTLSTVPIDLVGGKRYFVQALLKEGGGDDYLQVAWRTPFDTNLNDVVGLQPIPGKYLQTYVDPVVSLGITQQPTNVNVAANSTATFSVRYGITNQVFSTADIQWQKAASGSSTFADIAGATSQDYTIQLATPDLSGTQYRAIVTAGSVTNITSAAATLTVATDTVPPKVVEAHGSVSSVEVTFDEPLDATSAASAANYKISGAVTVTSAAVTSGANQPGVIHLAISGATAGQNYTLTINGVKDVSGNTIAANSTTSFTAYSASYAFNDGQIPAGTTVYSPAVVRTTGGVNNSGALELTAAVGSQQGGFAIPDLANGNTISNFTANFKLFIGNGSGNPADGFSFNFGTDLPQGSTSEEGAGTGITVAFDTYDNGGGEAPAIGIKVGGTEFATTNLAKATLVNNQFVDVTIRLNADNTLDVIHNGTTYFDHVPLDVQGYTPLAGASFLFGARTGGEFEQTVLDNVSIIVNGQATAPPAQAQFTSITKQGNNIVITWTGSGTLQETSSLAPATWTPVAGNPSGTYTTPAATSGNKFYRIATAQ